MSTRLSSAIVLGLAIVAGPMNAGGAAAAGFVAAATEATPAEALAATIQVAADAAARNTPKWKTLSPEAKAAIIKAAVARALAASSLSAEQKAEALNLAVHNGAISAAVAVSVASGVSQDFAQVVSGKEYIVNALRNQGLTTASTTVDGQAVTVLTTLESSVAPNDGATVTPTVVTPAPYDPCAGVSAAYCS